MNPLRLLLFPLSLLYLLGVWIRNKLYDLGIIHSHRFDIFTISVGNLTTGGTGKTPHTIYLIEMLKKEFNTACLSRGYGRKTSGYILADRYSTSEQIGDEPAMFKQRFPRIPVAVDENRVRGIRYLEHEFQDLDIIVLDDAYQHRRVKPEVNILLTEYSRLYVEDFLLPVGNLREPASNSDRADIIVVTKCPKVLSPLDKRALKDKLKPGPHQHIYFSYMEYGALKPVNEAHGSCPAKIDKAVLFTGIANSEQLYYYLQARRIDLTHLQYPDHHNFTKHDAEKLVSSYNSLSGRDTSIIITTEKDYMRMKDNEAFDPVLDLPVYIQPIEVKFHGTDAEELKEQIIEYVRRNQVHSNISKRENKTKT